MSYQFPSGGLQLVGRLVRPERLGTNGAPGLIITHGFPTKSNGQLNAGRSYYDLAERVSEELGWMALAFTFRGCGESEGDFSLAGWLEDIQAAVEHLDGRDDVDGVWLAGFGTGGALSIVAAAANPRVRGGGGCCATSRLRRLGSGPRRPTRLRPPRRGHLRPEFPEDLDAWNAELAEISALAAVPEMADRPLLLLHGADDDVVPVFDARVIADAHGSTDLRIISGGGHRLRFDPRAVAVFLGWLDRMANQSPDVREDTLE